MQIYCNLWGVVYEPITKITYPRVIVVGDLSMRLTWGDTIHHSGSALSGEIFDMDQYGPT